MDTFGEEFKKYYEEQKEENEKKNKKFETLKEEIFILIEKYNLNYKETTKILKQIETEIANLFYIVK